MASGIYHIGFEAERWFLSYSAGIFVWCWSQNLRYSGIWVCGCGLWDALNIWVV